MGFPRYQVGPGERYRYEFEVCDRAGTYWHHAMPAGRTPEQVYFGLTGLLEVSDKEEQALTLPRDEYDVPVVIQDRSFGADNQLRYLSGTGPDAAHAVGSSGEAPGMDGMMSDSPLPDGARFPILKVAVTHKTNAGLNQQIQPLSVRQSVQTLPRLRIFYLSRTQLH